MRPRRLVTPLTVIFALGSVAPGMAAEFDVSVPDFGFEPQEQRIAVGDRVVWSFTDDVAHSTRSLGGQADSWNSGLRSAGGTFARAFAKRGRFDYMCGVHFFMTGEITVGTDAVADTVDAFKTRRKGTSVTISFTLNEPATMTYSLRGASRRTLRRTRLEAGSRRFTVRRLRKGSYRATLRLTDDFDKAVTRKRRFAIR